MTAIGWRRTTVAALAAACALGALAPVVSRAKTPPPSRIAPALADSLDSAEGAVPVLVFVHGTTVGAGAAAVRAVGATLVGELTSVDVAIAAATADQIDDLAASPLVMYVEPDRELQLFLSTSRAAIRASEAMKTPGLAFDGSGQTIAIVDAGIDGTHPMFRDPKTGKSRVVRNLKVLCTDHVPGFTTDAVQTCPRHVTGHGADNERFIADFTSVNDTDTVSASGHGTHVTGIAAGGRVTAGGETFSGVARGAKIVALSMGAGISVYGEAAALDWVARHHRDPCGNRSCPPITVVNNSYGAVGAFDPRAVVSKLQTKLVREGVVMVWANGNGNLTTGGGDGTTNMSGSDAQHPLPGVISVANYDDLGKGSRDGKIDESSSRGQKTRPESWPDLSAPGTSVTSACRPQLVVCRGTHIDPLYGTIGGTSMAAPHVAGVVAILRQANPALTPAQVEDILEDTAHKFRAGAPYVRSPRTGNDSGSSFDKGHGLVDVVAALGRALGRPVAPAAGPTAAPPQQFVDTAPPPSKPSATVAPGKPWKAEGKSPADNFVYECSGPGDKRCVTYVLDVAPAGPSWFDLTLASDAMGTVIDDFDLFVYDASGTEAGVSGNPQTVLEIVSVKVDRPGRYTIVVQPYWATTESPFTLRAEVNPS